MPSSAPRDPIDPVVPIILQGRPPEDEGDYEDDDGDESYYGDDISDGDHVDTDPDRQDDWT